MKPEKNKLLDMELILHTAYGGFHIDTEMALWLMESRKWDVLKEKEYNYKTEYRLETLVESGSDYYYAPRGGEIAFRSHKDLIECVKVIKKHHENDGYRESTYGHIHKLSIVKVALLFEIEDYDDGHERVNIITREERIEEEE